jgi:hypothetical protein
MPVYVHLSKLPDLFVVRGIFTANVFILVDQPDGSHKGPSPGCEMDIQEFPTVFLVFFPGLLRLYGVRHCHDEAVPLLPFGLDDFVTRIPMFQQNFTVYAEFTLSPHF